MTADDIRERIYELQEQIEAGHMDAQTLQRLAYWAHELTEAEHERGLDCTQS